MKRSEIREAAFYLVFESLFGSGSPEEILDTAREADNFDLEQGAEDIFLGVCSKAQELDKIISSFSEKRTIGRIPKVNLAVLRIALYEYLYDEKVHGNIAISEAVILAKKFAYEADAQFVNGVLGEFFRRNEAEAERQGKP